MDNRLISVIVPVYNVEKYLDRCVESIVNQTYNNLEIILVDDGSPDNCPQMCDEWAKKDNRITVIHKENGGVSSARNAALDISNGEYVSFIDSDDYIDLNLYEIFVNYAEKYDIDMFRFSYYIHTEGRKGLVPAEVVIKPVLVNDKNQFLSDLHYDGHKSAFIANKIFKRECIGNNRFNTNYVAGEDVLFVYSVLSNAKCVMYYDIPLYFYYVHEGQCNFRKDFNYEVFRTFNYLTDNDPVILMYYKFFVFCCMAIRDSINNNDFVFYEIRRQVLKKKERIKKAIIIKKDIKSFFKLTAICFLPSIYCLLIKKGL